MPSPGIIIGVETSGAINNLEKFREALTKSGASAKLTTEEVQKLEKGFNEKLNADTTAKKVELARRQIEQLGKAAGLSAVEVKKLGDSMGVNMTHMNAGVQSASRLSTMTSTLGGSFSSLVPAIGGAVLAYMTLSKAIGAVHAYMEKGINFNKEMESSALGISSILAATQEISTLDGRRLQGQERLNAAMSVAKGLMDEIQILGVQTTSTTKDLVQGFQTILGPASEAGLSLGQTKDVVVNIVQAMSALGIKTQELSQEGRALLTGDIDRNARLATSLQITKSMVDEWKSQGTLFDNISKKLEAFKLAGSASAQTWVGLTSNLEEAADIISGMGTKGLFEGSKQGISTLLSSLLQVKNDALIAGDSISNITAGLETMGNDLGGFVAGSAQTLVEKFGELNTWISHNKEELGEIYDKTAAILGSIVDILEYFGSILTTVSSVAVETGVVSTALSVAHATVVLIQEAVGYIELAFRAVGLVVLKNVCGPLASAARLAAQLGGSANIIDKDQIAGLENYASGLEKNISDAEAALQKSGSRYSNTPFPAIAKANAEVQKLNDNLKETKKEAAGFKVSAPGGYSETDSEKLMKGNGSAQYRLNQEWKEGLTALNQLDAKIKSGTLSNEDMTRALNDQKAVWGHIGEAQESFEKKANKGSKAAERAAIAAERYSAAQQAFYDQTMASMDQIHDSLTGGFEKNAQGIDKSYERIFDSIRQKVIDAKGDVSGYAAVWVEAWNRWPGDKQLAVLKDQTNELKKQAQLLKDIADATGDPAMQAKASVYDADAWYAERKQQIENTYKDEAEKSAMMAALQDGYNAKILKGRADAYEGIKAVSSEYWNAEKQLIEANLANVKAHAEDETAYKIYEAQRWDEFYKAQMESQAANAGSFADTLSAKWSLAFGGYKSEATKAKDSWNEMSDGIINASEGMVDGIAGGFGDMIRNIGNGTASIEDMWKNMLSRMLDMFASFVEDLIKSQLKKMIGGLFSGSTGTGTDALQSSVSSISGMRDGGTGSSGGFGDILGLGKSIGKGIVDIFSSGDSGSTAFISKLSDATAIEKTVQAASPSGYTALTSGASQGGALATNAASSATSMLGTIGTTLGVLGAIGGVVGLVASLFGGQEEEVKKTASGYNVGYKSGHATASGVDFYSDGSTVSTGPSDPDIQRKISESFKDTAESLSDFAEELGFAVEVLDGFEFPTMDITEDQLDGYIRNGQNQMAFQGLMEAGLRGAFDAVLEDGEIYVDEFERLSTSFSTVSGGLEAYGYELADVAMISQENIDALRVKNTEVAEGTAQALATMAAAMGATSDFVSQVASDTSIAAAALTVTDEQLSNILEADYASKLLDAVGGQDAFDAMMGNLTKNIFDTVGALAENLDYYNLKASTAISKLDESGVTIENFWEKFDEAIKAGLTVDQFEAWGKASTWVNQIDTVTEAMEDWANSMNNLEGSLEARKAEALGMSDQAKYIQLLYTAENELYEARKNNYDEAVIAKIEEVQALELARQLYEMAKKATQALQDLNMREMEVTGNPYADIMQAYYDNGWELQEAMESGLYSEADIARMADIQQKEIDKLWKELGDAMTDAATSAHSRMLKAAGKTDEAAMYDFQISAAQELEDALESGLYTAESYSELMRAIALEAKNLEKEQARQRKKDFVDAFMSGPLDLEQQKNSYALTVLQDQISVAEAVKELLDGTYQSIESAYNTMNSLATSLKSTLQGFRWNDNLSPNTATQTFAEQSDYYAELLGKVNSTDKSDMDYSKNIQDLQSFAGTYLESAKGYYGASQEYWRIYEAVTGKLEGLQIDTQTDSDIYREQLLAQKDIVNKNQLQIDALTLANTKISQQLALISLMQATDDLAYKQEAVAQNMTQAQLNAVIELVYADIERTVSDTDRLIASLEGNGQQINAMADGVISAVFGTSSGIVGGLDSNKSQLISLANDAYTNASNQIETQKAIYAAEASRTDIQINELTLHGQLSKLALNNQEYLNQLINAEKSLIGEGLLNDAMQEALLTILANYAAYQASLAVSSLTTDAESNWYLSEINRIVNGGYNYWAMAGGYAEAIYNKNNEIVGYLGAIYSTLADMNSKVGTTTDGTSSYLGGFASGGEVTGPGWFMAGENGPEPVLLNGGGKASVTSNDDFTGSVDTNTRVTAAGLSALLGEMKAMRKELAQIRSTGQRAVAAPARN